MAQDTQVSAPPVDRKHSSAPPSGKDKRKTGRTKPGWKLGEPIQVRILRYVRKNSNGCWNWLRSLEQGYARIRHGRRTTRAHRVLYEALVGPVPDGMELDHTCRNRRCVNPAHLEPVTHKENMWRSPLFNGNKTHCPQGHPLSGENIYIKPCDGRRRCRICISTQSAARRRERIAARRETAA